MSENQFWEIIEVSRREGPIDQDHQLGIIREELRKLSPYEITEFQRLISQKLVDSYKWDLWNAAYLINGGCSDDGFHYFRLWLISCGQATHQAAVNNPDTLAGLTDPERDDYEFEALDYLPREVFEEMTKKEMAPEVIKWPKEPKGEEWDVDDEKEVARMFPALSKIYRS
jgi:hypothetical protein